MITDFLRASVEKYHGCEALKEVEFVQGKYTEKGISWERFNVLSNKVANYLIKFGIKKGDKVGILLHNCIEWLPIFLALSKQVQL